MNGVPRDLLPDDIVFAEDLQGLGFVITKDDKIRYIVAPDQGPRYKVNRSDRINKVHIEALHKAIRTSITDRLLGMGMQFMKIPKGSKQQVPIMVSSNMTTAPRVVVFCGEVVEDLGIFSYRDACDDGISFGSILGFAKGLLGENAQDSPNALILANPGHTVWYNSGWFAMTPDSVQGQHRTSAVERKRPLSARNTVGSIGEHVQNIFEQVLMRGNFRVGARIDVIGLSEGGHAAMAYLKNQWSFWSPHISSLSLINPETILDTSTKTDDLKDPESFAWFMKYRCRGWIICDKPIGTRVPDLNLPHGYNTYSSGEGTKSACMITRGVAHILTWMKIMHYSPMAMENFDVVPGKTDSGNNAILTSSINDIPGVPGGKIEVHSLDVMNQMKGFLAGVTFTKEMVTFFNDNLHPSDDKDNESDDSSDCSSFDRVENEDEIDALPDVPKVLPDASLDGSRDALSVPGVLPDAPLDSSSNILPNASPAVSNVAPDGPNVLSDAFANALSVPETSTHYDDVIVSKTDPFDLKDLQDIREDDEEE
ncbi:Ribosomal protein S14 [Penicillium expansum]|nr:Ribosomal protein S14 [Penicillium expansum]